MGGGEKGFAVGMHRVVATLHAARMDHGDRS